MVPDSRVIHLDVPARLQPSRKPEVNPLTTRGVINLGERFVVDDLSFVADARVGFEEILESSVR